MHQHPASVAPQTNGSPHDGQADQSRQRGEMSASILRTGRMRKVYGTFGARGGAAVQFNTTVAGR